MQFTDHRAWTDLGPSSKLKPPNVVITAAELALMSTNQVTSDLYLLGNETRKVVYAPAVGTKVYMELVLYVQPVGTTFVAPALLVAQSEGRLISWAGALTGANNEANLVAGMMIGPYYSGTNDNPNVSYIVDSLAAGDAIWVCRRGNVALTFTGNSLANRSIKTAANGDVQVCNVKYAGYHADNDAYGSLGGLGIGDVDTISLGANLKNSFLNLPLRFRRGT